MKRMILIMSTCCWLFIGCGLHQSTQNTEAIKDIKVGMTESEVENLLVLSDREKSDPRLRHYIKTEEGEAFLVKWYRISLSVLYPAPFVYQNGRLVGFENEFLREFSSRHGFNLYAEKRFEGSIFYVPMYPEDNAKKEEQDAFKSLESLDPYLAARLKSFDTNLAAFKRASKEWAARSEQWNKDAEGVNGEQTAYLKSLSVQQLEIYAKYEEALKENKPASKELYLRKLSTSLSADQKARLANLSDIDRDLDGRKRKLEEERQYLTSEQERLKKEHADILNYVRSALERSYAAQASLASAQTSGYQILANGLNEIAEGMRRQSEQQRQWYYQQEQTYQMYQMNTSLQSISRAVRGY
jgi:hypothetical protein